MNVTQSSLSLAGRSYSEWSERLSTTVRSRQLAPKAEAPPPAGDTLTLGATPLPTSATTYTRQAHGAATRSADGDGSVREAVLRMMIEKLTGRKVRGVHLPGEAQPGAQGRAQAAELPTRASGAARQGGIEITVTREIRQEESLLFAAQGTVATEDGRQMSFQFSLELKRTTVQQDSISLRSGGALTDPLVLGMEGQTPSLTGDRFLFDLDSDGTQESLPLPSSGTAFLVWDRNGDGMVNDGSELFGPSSGSGLAELAALDSDGDQWIDEADPEFAKLRVWQPETGGPGDLQGLLQAGVGALSTQQVATPWRVVDDQGGASGQVRTTGVYLSEAGGAGLLQQVDLANSEPAVGPETSTQIANGLTPPQASA